MCISQLINAYKFKQKCEQIERLVQNYIQQKENVIINKTEFIEENSVFNNSENSINDVDEIDVITNEISDNDPLETSFSTNNDIYNEHENNTDEKKKKIFGKH